MIQAQPLRYQSYLLRCWEEADASSALTIWRFSLEDPRTGQRRGFANLTTLVIALQDELMGCLSEQKNGAEEQEGGGAGE